MGSVILRETPAVQPPYDTAGFRRSAGLGVNASDSSVLKCQRQKTFKKKKDRGKKERAR